VGNVLREVRRQLDLPQLDRVRWHLFPEIRLPDTQEGLFKSDETADVEIPDLMRVMDLQQEQLARSLGEGHRVIHGVAGSGKTLILGYRAEQLAKCAPSRFWCSATTRRWQAGWRIGCRARA
jgi:hypothetical protein